MVDDTQLFSRRASVIGTATTIGGSHLWGRPVSGAHCEGLSLPRPAVAEAHHMQMVTLVAALASKPCLDVACVC